MSDSIFTKIINREIPAHIIYEDDKVIAFLDINPVNPGHTLVVPKIQVEDIWDLDDETYQYLFKIVKKLGIHVKQTLQPLRVGVVVEGFDVPHTHVHIIPLISPANIQTSRGDSPQPSQEELAVIAQKLIYK